MGVLAECPRPSVVILCSFCLWRSVDVLGSGSCVSDKEQQTHLVFLLGGGCIELAGEQSESTIGFNPPIAF